MRGNGRTVANDFINERQADATNRGRLSPLPSCLRPVTRSFASDAR
jgi:hypothetical protein